MNRRGFFKALAGTAIGAAVLPEIWMPSKTIFLPPRQGWWQPELRMREVQQYFIDTDSIGLRHDVKWQMPDGWVEQAYILSPHYGVIEYSGEPLSEAIVNMHRETAREQLANMVPRGATIIELPLPRGVGHSRYV